ncbi:hypothetical protein PSD17_23770 [Pseudonocardia sp. D17]|nr:hypothetical protein PSD17_23770 [Pseudonocardia sp. D17]
MPLAVGIDVAKHLHWMSVVDTATGKQLASHKVANDPTAITAMIDEVGQLAAEHGPDSTVTYGIDVLGGIAGLLTAMLLDHGAAVVHTPGLLINRSRRATRRQGTQVRPRRREGHRRPDPAARQQRRPPRPAPPGAGPVRAGRGAAAAGRAPPRTGRRPDPTHQHAA